MSKEKTTKSSSLLRSDPKNIFCLEALWNGDVESKLTVLPILELLSKTQGIKYIHLSSNTRPEFEFNLDHLTRRRSYQILYLAFHGQSDQIELGNSVISLNELAEILGGRFKDLTVHFGSCGTLNLDRRKLTQFTKTAGIRMLSGYTKNVDWVESAAMDMLYFSALQSYKNISYLDSFLRKTYKDLIKNTGFTTFKP